MLPYLLLVDDDPLIAESLAYLLARDYTVRVAASRLEAVAWLKESDICPVLALVDLGLPPVPHRPDEGFRLISELLALRPELRILVLSGQNDEAHAREARALGALDFVAKPCPPEVLRQALQRMVDLPAVPVAGLEAAIVGRSVAIQALRDQIRQFAPAPFPVLVTGESGCGKELVARGLHECGPRGKAPFVTLNCAAITETLFESTLFGHARGAFTGAVQAAPGYIEEAGQGTLFLDEIGEMPLDLQAKLLRVLENGEYHRVGETQPRKLAARIVAATNRPLEEAVRAGQFRADLYYRLSVLTVHVPPLRDRPEDALALWHYFVDRYAAELGAAPCLLEPAAEQLWCRYAFPGNVRELRNIVIRLLTRYPAARVSAAALEAELVSPVANPAPTLSADMEALARRLIGQPGFQLDNELKTWEAAFIRVAMDLAAGNLSQAARLLGVNRTTLYSRITK